MLTPAQYEAVGRVALAFNELEYFIETYLSFILGTDEARLSEQLVSRERFLARKVDLFRDVLRALRIEYPNIQREIDDVANLLPKVKDLMDRRNQVVHGTVTRDASRKEFGLRFRNEWIAADVTTINLLARELADFTDAFNDICGELFVKLEEARAACA